MYGGVDKYPLTLSFLRNFLMWLSMVVKCSFKSTGTN